MRWNRLWTLLAISIALHLAVLALLHNWVIERPAPYHSTENFRAGEVPAVYDGDGTLQKPAESLYQVSTKVEPAAESPVFPSEEEEAPEAQTPVLPKNLEPGDELSNMIAKSDHTPVSFFGMQPQGRQIVFLIDISGSMLQRENGERRLDIVFREIKQLVAKLPGKTSFNVVLFADSAKAYSKGLVPSNFSEKASLFRFLNQDNDCGSGTNISTGLTVAMGMRPDTILLVTDGEANQASEVVLAETNYLMQKAKKLVAIQAVGFCLKPDSRAEDLLKHLAKETGGSYTLWIPSKT